jgi:hypothetical protein
MVCALLGLLVARPGRAIPPPREPLSYWLDDDVAAVDLAACDRLADRVGRYFLLELHVTYQPERRPSFRVRPLGAVPPGIIACVRRAFSRRERTAARRPRIESPHGDGRPWATAATGQGLELGEPARILPPKVLVIALLRGPTRGSSALAYQIRRARRCLEIGRDDEVVTAFFAWLQASFGSPTLLDDPEEGERERYRVDAHTWLVVRDGALPLGYVACLAPRGRPAPPSSRSR